MPAARWSLPRETMAGLGYLVRHPTLRGLAVAYSLYQVAWGILVVAVPVFVADELGDGKAADAMTGALWALAGLAGAAGALVAGHVRPLGRERAFIVLGTLATAVAIYPVGAVLGLAGPTAGLALAGFLEGPVDVGVLTLRQRRADPDRLGRVLAISISLNLAGLPLGSAVGGLLVGGSPVTAYVVAAGASVLAAAATAVLIPKRDPEPDPERDPERDPGP